MASDWENQRNEWGELLHPGRITFVDERDQSTREVDAETVPPGVRWHGTARGRVPITRIVYSGGEIFQYDPDGRLLAVTLQAPPG